MLMEHLTRRDWMHLSLGIAGAGLATGFPGCSPPPADSPQPPEPDRSYGNYEMGFQSYSLRHFVPVDDFLGQAKRLNLPFVELWRGHLPEDADEEEIVRFRERLREAGITVNAFGVERFTEEHEQNESIFRLARNLGARVLSANPSKRAFDSLEKLVDQYDIRIAIHNHGPEDERWRRPEWIMEAVDGLDPRIGACADLGHFSRAGVDPVAALEILGSRVLGVHLKDFDAEENDVVLGQGKLDVARTFETFRKLGFTGPVSLEFEGDKEDPVPAMLECLDVVAEAIAGTSSA